MTFRYLTFNQNTEPDESTEVGKGKLGNPVQSNIIFKELSYELQDGSRVELRDEEVEGDGYIRLDAVIMDARGVKRVKETPITGRNGTVNELINTGDVQVNIRGKITSEDKNLKPKKLQEKLRKLREAPVPVEIVCPFLKTEGVDTLVILEGNVREKRGGANYYEINIKAKSQTPAEAEIIDLTGQDGTPQPAQVPPFA